MSEHEGKRILEDEAAASGDAGEHGPEERTASLDPESGHAPASDVERARGKEASDTTTGPKPPPREGEEPDARERDVQAEEFVDDL